MKLIAVDEALFINDSTPAYYRAVLYADAETGVVYFSRADILCPRYDSNGRIMVMSREQISQAQARYAAAVRAKEAGKAKKYQVTEV